MAKLTRDDVLKLARLARIQLNDDEVAGFTDELSHIISYVDQLAAVDVADLEPTSQVTGLVNVTREDVIAEQSYDVKDLQKNVPAMLDGQIKVKRMLG